MYCDAARIFELCPPELDAVEGGGEDGARVQARHRAGHVVLHAGPDHGHAYHINRLPVHACRHGCQGESLLPPRAGITRVVSGSVPGRQAGTHPKLRRFRLTWTGYVEHCKALPHRGSRAAPYGRCEVTRGVGRERGSVRAGFPGSFLILSPVRTRRHGGQGVGLVPPYTRKRLSHPPAGCTGRTQNTRVADSHTHTHNTQLAQSCGGTWERRTEDVRRGAVVARSHLARGTRTRRERMERRAGARVGGRDGERAALRLRALPARPPPPPLGDRRFRVLV